MEQREKLRISTEKATIEAAAQWAKAPMHIKAMAGAYVAPLLAALVAINEELRHSLRGNP